MKRNLLLGMSLLAGMAASAVTSPYTGAPAAEGTYYLYQVESGLWLQTNISDIETWTTHASLESIGFDIQLIKGEGYEGFQIDCNFTGNGCLNGADQDRFYLDQNDRDKTDWIFEPVTVEGVSNAYKIMAKATPEDTPDRSKIAADVYIGATDGKLSDQPEQTTWQLVTRAERLARMQTDCVNGPVDCTWLLPWNDMGRNDKRDRIWNRTDTNNHGGGTGFDGSRGYPVKEYWHKCTMLWSFTMTDLPNGTYEFASQSYYRDTDYNDAGLAERYANGTENLRAEYFAGAARGTVQSIFACAKDEATDGFPALFEGTGKYVPNSMGDASRAMFNGEYINPYIQTAVTDGKLIIGLEKATEDHRDWFIIKRFFLRYVSTTPIAEDLTALRTQLSELITKAEGLPSTPKFASFITEAKDALTTANSGTSLIEAINALKGHVNTLESSKGNIENYHRTKAITDAMGIDASDAVEAFNNAVSNSDFENALKRLRYARRINTITNHADIFPGHAPEFGTFYLYNVGRGLFLCGGSDWGAHAALGMPGIEIQLEDGGQNGAGDQKYYVETGLWNGDKHYMNYRGYMDCPKIDGFTFVPVEGKENTYNIVQGDYTDVHMAWNPFAGVDAGHSDELTVGTECRNLDPQDPNAQWKLVTRAEREALMENASLQNPVDVTFFMKSPNFNQRENANSVWSFQNFGIWEYGANHYDFVAESFNSDEADMCNMVEGLPEGIYQVAAQGYYRNGDINFQVNNDKLQNAVLYAGNETADDVPLPNITAETHKAPGEGKKLSNDDNVEYELPDNCVQAADYFKSGLYKVYTVIEKTDTEDLPVGVMKETKGGENDWVVADNFRLIYYGKNTTKDAVKNQLQSGVDNVVVENYERPADNRIFNLQGIEVKNPTAAGIYIQNGRKFIVR